MKTGEDGFKGAKTIIFLACLVTDKKYRKMGGGEALISELQKYKIRKDIQEDVEVLIRQIPIEELIKTDDFDENFKNIIEKYFGVFDHTVSIILVHKYSDFYRIPDMARKRVKFLRDWLSNLKSVRVLDDPEKIDVLSSRVQTGNLIREMCKEEGFESMGLQWPEFHIESMGDLQLPVIIKPVDACSTDDSHWMTLLNTSEIGEGDSFQLHDGVLVQKFYEHYGILYKVYVIGDTIEIVSRPSISAQDNGSVFRFNTHKFKLLAGDLDSYRQAEAIKRIEPLRGLIESFVRSLKTRLQLTWFGIDILIPEDSTTCNLKAAVIDINYMPGFDGVPDLTGKLIKAILD